MQPRASPVDEPQRYRWVGIAAGKATIRHRVAGLSQSKLRFANWLAFGECLIWFSFCRRRYSRTHTGSKREILALRVFLTRESPSRLSSAEW
jgi:hypothetical protein